MTLTGCDYKSMEFDCLLLQIFRETLSECCFGAKADGMAALPFLVPAEGHLYSGSSLNSFAFRRSINPNKYSNSYRKCMETSLENLYVDIEA